jgi:hypothetical protein
VPIPAVKRRCCSKYCLEGLRVDAARPPVGRLIADHARPLAVELDQLAAHVLALGAIAAQQPGCTLPPQHRGQLPAEVEAVLHREVHALAGLRAVRMAGVAGDEHARQPCLRRIRRQIVVALADAVADLVDRPPGHFLHLQRVGLEDALRRGDDLLDAKLAAGDALVLGQLVHLHVQAHQVAAFARDDEQVAAVCRLDRHLVADVGEVGQRQHVHHAPGLVGRVAHQFKADRPAHRAARAVAADDVARAHRLDPPCMRSVAAFQAQRHRIVGRSRVDLEPEQPARIVRRQPAG